MGRVTVNNTSCEICRAIINMTVAKVASAEDAETAGKEGRELLKDRARRFFADSSLLAAEVKHHKKCVLILLLQQIPRALSG